MDFIGTKGGRLKQVLNSMPALMVKEVARCPVLFFNQVWRI